jgi:hypothetical protein
MALRGKATRAVPQDAVDEQSAKLPLRGIAPVSTGRRQNSGQRFDLSGRQLQPTVAGAALANRVQVALIEREVLQVG